MTVELTDANVVAFIVNNATLTAVAAAHRGEDDQLIEACNGYTGVGSGNVAGDSITPSDLTKLLDAQEFRTFTNSVINQMLFLKADGIIVMGSPETQEKLNLILDQYPTSLAAVQQKYTRPGTLWECHFGKGLVCNQDILDRARNSGNQHNF